MEWIWEESGRSKYDQNTLTKILKERKTRGKFAWLHLVWCDCHYIFHFFSHKDVTIIDDFFPYLCYIGLLLMRIHQLSFPDSKTYPQILSLSLGFKSISVEDTPFPGRKKGDFMNCCLPPPPNYLQIVISSWWKTFKSFFREEDANYKAARGRVREERLWWMRSFQSHSTVCVRNHRFMGREQLKSLIVTRYVLWLYLNEYRGTFYPRLLKLKRISTPGGKWINGKFCMLLPCHPVWATAVFRRGLPVVVCARGRKRVKPGSWCIFLNNSLFSLQESVVQLTRRI